MKTGRNPGRIKAFYGRRIRPVGSWITRPFVKNPLARMVRGNRELLSETEQRTLLTAVKDYGTGRLVRDVAALGVSAETGVQLGNILTQHRQISQQLQKARTPKDIAKITRRMRKAIGTEKSLAELPREGGRPVPKPVRTEAIAGEPVFEAGPGTRALELELRKWRTATQQYAEVASRSPGKVLVPRDVRGAGFGVVTALTFVLLVRAVRGVKKRRPGRKVKKTAARVEPLEAEARQAWDRANEKLKAFLYKKPYSALKFKKPLEEFSPEEAAEARRLYANLDEAAARVGEVQKSRWKGAEKWALAGEKPRKAPKKAAAKAKIGIRQRLGTWRTGRIERREARKAEGPRIRWWMLPGTKRKIAGQIREKAEIEELRRGGKEAEAAAEEAKLDKWRAGQAERETMLERKAEEREAKIGESRLRGKQYQEREIQKAAEKATPEELRAHLVETHRRVTGEYQKLDAERERLEDQWVEASGGEEEGIRDQIDAIEFQMAELEGINEANTEWLSKQKKQ